MTQQEEMFSAKLDFVLDGLTRLEVAIKERFRNILVSCNEAARHLKCTPNTVSKMLADGRLKKTTIGGSTGIRYSDILDLKEGKE